MKKPLIATLLPLGIMAIIIMAGIWMWGWVSVNSENQGQSLPVLGTVGDFSFTERSGAQITRADLDNYIWIADFIFTNCAGPCPMMTNRMSQLQTSLEKAEDVRFLSISVDPERDTPEVLSNYATGFNADPHKWLFLTGDKSEIYDFAHASLKLSVREEPGETHIIHSTKFVLIDKTGQIRGYYNSLDGNELGQLVVDLERLRRAG